MWAKLLKVCVPIFYLRADACFACKGIKTQFTFNNSWTRSCYFCSGEWRRRQIQQRWWGQLYSSWKLFPSNLEQGRKRKIGWQHGITPLQCPELSPGTHHIKIQWGSKFWNSPEFKWSTDFSHRVFDIQAMTRIPDQKPLHNYLGSGPIFGLLLKNWTEIAQISNLQISHKPEPHEYSGDPKTGQIIRFSNGFCPVLECHSITRHFLSGF